ncbi:MAG: pseudouridine synthase [Phycisphaerales bacterium]|jgi:pseudouridine synthase|nr:pseudouridine synthase [Phycisphaerales bacterium]
MPHDAKRSPRAPRERAAPKRPAKGPAKGPSASQRGPRASTKSHVSRPAPRPHAAARPLVAPLAEDDPLRQAGPGRERLQRVLADAGLASRRACEELILTGRVEINGRVVASLPVFVNTREDEILVDGRPVRLKPEKGVYVLLNKPARTLSTVSDEPGLERRTVLDMIAHPSGARLYPVGRLDYDTRGLVLLTNDGDLANQLTHPRYGVPKTYNVVVAGRPDEAALDDLRRGIFLAERRDGQTRGASRTRGIEVEVIKIDRDRSTLRLTLREGKNRQVRRMLAAVGCKVKKLERVAIGPLQLRGLARGEWRDLTSTEVAALRRAVERKDAPRPSTPATKKAGASKARAAANGPGAPKPAPRTRVLRPTGGPTGGSKGGPRGGSVRGSKGPAGRGGGAA